MKKIVLILVAIMYVGVVLAQDGESVFSRSIKLSFGYIGVGNVDAGTVIDGDKNARFTTVSSGWAVMVDADLWQLWRSVSMGLYVGLGPSCYELSSTSFNSQSDIRSTVGMHFGVSINVHLMSLMKINSKHWDVVAKGSIGSYYAPFLTPQTECGFGLSAAWYPGKHFGLFAEYNWGAFKYNHDFHSSRINKGSSLLKAGMSIRF